MNSDFLSSLIFSVNVTLPTLLLLLIGMVLRRRQFLDDAFCEKATRLIFNLTLPLLLFFNVYGSKIDYADQLPLIIVAFVGTTFLFVSAEIFAGKFIAEKRERCTFVQSVFRGNNGILGLAFCVNAYGNAAFAPASIYSAVLIFLYNIYGVITITRSLSSTKVRFSAVFFNILKNPLIIGIVSGLAMNFFAVPLPEAVVSTGHHLANITLPLALICTGATINFKTMGWGSRVISWGVIGRLIVAPAVMIAISRLFGISGMELGIVLLMTTTPLAAATYAMVRGMGGNGVTVANIIGITTIGSAFASSLGLIILSQLGWL